MPLGAAFPPTPKEILISLRHPAITKALIVPLFLEQLIPWLRQDDDSGFKTMARLQCVMSGGAPCSPPVYKELVKHGVNLNNVYGSTG